MIEEKTLGAEDTNINELRKLRDELTSQRDALRAEVAELREAAKEKEAEAEGLRQEKAKLEAKVRGLQFRKYHNSQLSVINPLKTQDNRN